VHQDEARISAVAAGAAAGAAADFALDDVAADGTSGLLARSRSSTRSGVANPVRRAKMQSKRARISLRRLAVAAARNVLRSA